MRIEDFELRPEDLANPCREDTFSFSSTKDLEPLDDVIGQERGLRALEFGVSIQGEGYNVFVLGPKGTGRNTAVRTVLEQAAARRPAPQDWCYVNNFQDPHKPIAIGLPAGKGREFRDDMTGLVNELGRRLEQVFESESYRRRREEITHQIQETQAREFAELQEKARRAGFALQRSGALFGIVPLKDGKPLDRDEYSRLPPEEQAAIEERGQRIRQELGEAMKNARQVEKEATEAVRQLDREAATIAIKHAVEEMREKYKDFEKITAFLDAVQEHVIDNVRDFLGDESEDPALAIPGLAVPRAERVREQYGVNLIVAHRHQTGAPVVFESNPTHANLVGRIEHKAHFGALVTNFTMLKAGALHRANGGFLVLQVRDILTNFMAWDALKRCLKNKSVRIEDLNEQFRLITTVSLEPEPIPLDVKIVLVGQPLLFYLLYALDEDFSKLFKVKADFDDRLERNDETVRTYARFLSRLCGERALPPFEAAAVGRIIEYGSRVAEDQRKLTGALSVVADLAHEAAFWSRQNGNGSVREADVEKAIAEKVYRSNRIEERIREMIAEGTILIDHTGEKVGQVNGMAVILLGDYEFGKPSRITARAFAGRTGVVNIDREAKLTGRIHDKGVLILSGYLGGRYARDKPLSLSATVCFEQSYEGVEGDSASSTELYALLSAIGQFPVKQGIAVTGSVNQHGEIQPVGGVTQKVEGFYDVCRVKGLTGEQGVIIPKQNVKNLNLRPDVREAVREGKFHVYAVSHIEEGLFLLSGLEPGEVQADGSFPEGTANQRIDAALEEFARVWKKFGAPEKEAEAKAEEKTQAETEARGRLPVGDAARPPSAEDQS